MKTGIIGAGQIGSTLARRFLAVGHEVKLANSRGPQSLATLVAQIGAKAVAVEDAVRDVDLVVVTIPQKGVLNLPKGLFDRVPASTVVVDTGNYYPDMRDGDLPGLENGAVESQWVSDRLGRPVIKAFNNIGAGSLGSNGRPAGAAGRIGLPISGDDARAKAVVMALADQIGFDAVDAGPLAESWRQQPGTPVYCTDYDAAGVRERLARADRDRAPALRDLMIAKLPDLPQDADHQDVIAMIRGLYPL